ncbi:smoothelin, like isoform X1 [Engraulis encrasicolus]|uniref:smoothelin, like isoform X1 n=1 Tax=Engraulis encrasicolus TaxID=184585 RepID=UPI002FD37199
MDAGPMTSVSGDGVSLGDGGNGGGGETVCAALARYENTLRDAVREIHVDVSAFKLGVERRLEEALHVSGPLGCAVAQLQQENRQLRSQLEALTRQVEMLTCTPCDRSALLGPGSGLQHQQMPGGSGVGGGGGSSSTGHQMHGSSSGGGGSSGTGNPQSPSAGGPSSPCAGATGSASGLASSPTAIRFSSRATFAVSSKTNSIEREEPIEVDQAPTTTGLENGHTPMSESTPMAERESSPPGRDFRAPRPMAMPHLPITATTKTADPSASAVMRSPDSPSSPTMRSLPSSIADLQSYSDHHHHTAMDNQPLAMTESPVHQAPTVKTWSPSPIRTMGSPRLSERTASAPAKSVTYSGLAQQHNDRGQDGNGDTPFSRVPERRRELVRSQTLPRNIGAQARRSIFERLDSENNSRPKPVDSKPKLKRSQSFGVSSASSIKAILLEWCRSKTIGYQNIDIQNFSSSWSDGMAFCALVHSFFPTEFDYNVLTPTERKHNFEMAFGIAEAKAGCDRLIEVEDMMVMGRKPDPMCVFTYVQSLYNHLRKFE